MPQNEENKENYSGSDYWESEEKHDLRKSKRDTKPQVDLFSNFKINPLSKLFKRQKSGKPYRKSYRKNQMRKPRIPLSSTEQIRQKRLPSEEGSPCKSCGFTYQSCNHSEHAKQGCPGCYKCRCEPIEPREEPRGQPREQPREPEPQFDYRQIKIPYKVVGVEQTREETPRVVFQELHQENPSYTGLQQDMYKKYISRVISKYPAHLAKKDETIFTQQRDLMNFINELARSDIERPPTNDPKFKIIDEAVDLYNIIQGPVAHQPAPHLGVSNSKPLNKRGTVLEVIELDPYQVEKFESLIKKEPVT